MNFVSKTKHWLVCSRRVGRGGVKIQEAHTGLLLPLSRKHHAEVKQNEVKRAGSSGI